ncbi:hypothetical protein AC578_4447 [Pseudocercospora eumusae]|uniref:DUF1868 domain-containing protein n=1 Tax=Pseudocercospora eumusae TaxID=321146 RepID=A0A139HEU4_9PEZI|nr:hypothetical protein AC578_4447 [Pseudocercospora eumusae]
MDSIVAARPEYPPAVPGRFMPDGSASRNPGNTLICMIEEGSEIYRGIKAVYDALVKHPILSKKVHVMPPDSWHMTILDCVGEDNREPGWWPPGKEQQPLDECTRDFARRLRTLEGALEGTQLSPPYRVKGTGFDLENGVGIGLRVEGADADEEKRLRRLRDLLADTIGFRDLRHESYGFHVTICYFIRYIDGDDRAGLVKLLESLLSGVRIEFELGSVAFCEYENLDLFDKLLFVGEKEG